MTHRTGEIDKKLAEIAKYEDGDKFHAGDGDFFAICQRMYDFDSQTIYYEVKDLTDNMITRGKFDEKHVDSWELLDDEPVDKEEYNIDTEKVQVRSSEL